MPEGPIARIAVSGLSYGVDRPYDYLVPPELVGRVVPGMRVIVPFSRGNRPVEGIVLAITDSSEYGTLKSVAAALDADPILTAAEIKLAMWMRERFFCTVYDAVRAMLPTGLWFRHGKRIANDKIVNMVSLLVSPEEALEEGKRIARRAPQQAEILRTLSSVGDISSSELRAFTGASSAEPVKALERAGLLRIYGQRVFRLPHRHKGGLLSPPVLTSEQQEVYEGIKKLFSENEARAALLFGVTGSGKTTIYIRLISDALAAGKSSILLVPEISLTPQMISTFSSYFGGEVAVLHSSLSVGERFDEWNRIKEGRARVVIGTRSAVFAPVTGIGIIIIDEEQEDTYKSDRSPRYHARDIAKYRCAGENALLLLGSATPDVESRYWAEQGRYSYFTLSRRFNEMALPKVEIVDMRTELRRGNGGSISSFLRDELRKNIEAGEQSILFLNRRGASKLIACGACGHVYKCPNCSVSLTYHSCGNKLMCHYCGYTRYPDKACPECGGKLNYIGAGTQKVEEELSELFPGTGIMRMDADTVAAAGGHEALLSRFRKENIPILLGTQMVTKGLNFENVTLVGVVLADQSLYCSDYRSAERSFSLITQVIGRSGRFSRPGRAVIQTFTPENQIILQAADQDYDGFYNSEIKLRKLQMTPPFSELLTLTAVGANESEVLKCVRDIKLMLEANAPGARILGPAPLPIVRIKNNYRYRVTLCSPGGKEMRRLAADAAVSFSLSKSYRGVEVFADNDPSDT